MPIFLTAAVAFALASPAGAALYTDGPRIPDSAAIAISYRVWQNESGGSSEGLTHWNRGEGFASMGIGHFIWYPAGRRGPFDESFPRLLSYLEGRGVVLPAWLRDSPPCPWPDRRAFRRDLQSPRMVELRNLLTSTLALQARFMADRLESALPRMLASAPRARREALQRRFAALAAQEQGLYALIDYVNFKGEGVSPAERYNGRGWGLLQVLAQMRGDAGGTDALADFSRAACRVLYRRVRNSPPQRGESRWLSNWRHRVGTYLG